MSKTGPGSYLLVLTFIRLDWVFLLLFLFNVFILALFIIACLKEKTNKKTYSPYKYGKTRILSSGPINNKVRLGFSTNYLYLYILKIYMIIYVIYQSTFHLPSSPPPRRNTTLCISNGSSVRTSFK